MALFVEQVINGISLGSIYALMAIGFTLIFGVLRLLNMAHGELYMLGAYLGYTGIVLLGFSAWIALPSAAVLVFVVAVAIERVAFRPLRDAPHFIPLVSSLAVSTIVLEIVRIAYGPYMFGFESVIPMRTFGIGTVRVTSVQVFLLAVGLVLTAIVQLALMRTQLGKAIRDTSQDLVECRLLGLSVDRIIAGTFGIASALGAVAGMLVSMRVGAIYPDMGFIALVKAFTAAILGGMGSVFGAVLGGYVLGIVESLGSTYLPSGYSDAMPYIILFAVLVLLPGGLLGMKTEQSSQQAVGQMGQGLLDRLFVSVGDKVDPRGIGVALIAATAAAAPFLDDYYLRVLIIIALYAFMALGMNVILGLAGQLNLSHSGFLAIGAYASALLTTRAGLDAWTAIAAGAVLSALFAVLVSFATFRVRGYYLALVTLAFAEIVRVVISYWINLTRGMMGLRGIRAVNVGSFTFDTPLRFFLLSLAFLAIGLLAYRVIAYSTTGRALIALRDDETAARSTGLACTRLKIFAFVVSAVYASVGGSLLAHYYTAITPELANVHETVVVLTIAVVGGLGSAAGSIGGSAFVNLLPEAFRSFGDYRLLGYGVILLATILFQPQGLFSITRRLARTA
jgi:branched-chain amino acid transport system permease protein